MIVEITSLTLRVTLRRAGIAAQVMPTTTATSVVSSTHTGAGRFHEPIPNPKAAATSAASRYWPYTLMLINRILKPIANETPAMYYGTERFTMATTGLVPSMAF